MSKRCFVKQVLSGDTILVRDKPQNGPPPEKIVSLAYLNAPKLAKNANSTEEPFAWLSREFLRKKLVGKEVEIVVESKSSQNREYVLLYLPANGFPIKDPSERENINESIVAAGLCDVRKLQPTVNSENYLKLAQLEAAAKSEKRGKFCEKPSDEPLSVREIHWKIEEPMQFMESLKKKPIDAIIEYVRDGSSYRVCVLPLPGATNPVFSMISMILSGVKTPGFKMEGDKQVAEEYAEEARYFVETRILQRKVSVQLETYTGQNFVGSVLHPRGNIGQLLLQNGLARCVDWSIGMVSAPGGPELLRSCEKEAKVARIRLWKNHEPPTILNAKDYGFVTDDSQHGLGPGSSIKIQGKVIEVGNADNITIKCAHDNVERKFFLASVRPPRAALSETIPKGDRTKLRPLYAVPHMFEAREFLRKKLVGKKVTVLLDYIQPSLQEGQDDRKCATVMIGNTNVAEALVSKGLATVVRYKAGEDKRARTYDQLLAAEAVAVKKAVGVHDKKEHASMKVNELSGDTSKSKQFLPFLKRSGKLESIVEYVASGSRVRLFIPRETCVITFLLAGIECRRPSRNLPNGRSEPGDSFGDEAQAYAREHILQREVLVDVESIDKVGNFVGWLFTTGDVNFSTVLVENGLATVHFSAERSPYYHSLCVAEDKSKAARLGLWSSDEFWNSMCERNQEESKKEETSIERKRCPGMVLSVMENLRISVLPKEMESALQNMTEEISKYIETNPPVPHSYTPQKQGELCFAKYSLDNVWYRAKVLRLNKQQGKVMGVKLLFIDFGNEETIEKSSVGTRLCQMPVQFSKSPPMCKTFTLAGVKLPPDEDDQLAVTNVLQEHLANVKITYIVEYGDKARILPDSDQQDEGYILIRDGLVLADASAMLSDEVLQKYQYAQECAKEERRRIWRYGDCTGDEPL